MSVLVALALAAAPGCPEAMAAAEALADPALAARAPALARALEDAGAGPTAGLAAAAGRLADAPPGPAPESAAAFRGALASHCAFAAVPALPEASAADRAALAEVLARPELSQVRLDPGAIRRAVVRFWDWIVELLGTQEAERYASLGRALFLGAAAAALALAFAALRRRRRGSPRGDRAGAEEPGATAEAVPDVAAGRAEEALRRGDARGALRLALLSALGALERAGRVPRGRALTNEELVALVGGAGPLRPRLRPPHRDQDQDRDEVRDPEGVGATSAASDLAALARAFDRAVYGGLPVTIEDARDAVERARRLGLAGGVPP